MKDLRYFMLSAQSLTLYRGFMKAVSRIADEPTREDVRARVKNEYQRYRSVEDPSKMEYLITTGRSQLKMLDSFIPR
jgi:hypothetical protein